MKKIVAFVALALAITLQVVLAQDFSSIVRQQRGSSPQLTPQQAAATLRNIAAAINASQPAPAIYGVYVKTSGNHCGGHSCDIICRKTDGALWDVFGSGPDGGDNPEAPGPSTPGWSRVDGNGEPGRCEVVTGGGTVPDPDKPPVCGYPDLRVNLSICNDEVNVKARRITDLERDIDNERAQRIEAQADAERARVDANNLRVQLANVSCTGGKVFGIRASCRVNR